MLSIQRQTESAFLGGKSWILGLPACEREKVCCMGSDRCVRYHCLQRCGVIHTTVLSCSEDMQAVYVQDCTEVSRNTSPHNADVANDLRSFSRPCDLGKLSLTVGRREVEPQEDLVGRTYYRRPNAESSADVFDRVKQPLGFWRLSPSVCGFGFLCLGLAASFRQSEKSGSSSGLLYGLSFPKSWRYFACVFLRQFPLY